MNCTARLGTSPKYCPDWRFTVGTLAPPPRVPRPLPHEPQVFHRTSLFNSFLPFVCKILVSYGTSRHPATTDILFALYSSHKEVIAEKRLHVRVTRLSPASTEKSINCTHTEICVL